jgi:ubiquinone/menaquinone biosynthesis C-methylase UbiE
VAGSRFDRWAPTYDRSWLQRLLFARVHAAVLDAAAEGPAPGVVLDVGCGTGRLLRAVHVRWPAAALLGVDPAPRMVMEARRLLPSATFFVAPAEQLPVPDASVDLVLSTVSFHHWSDQRAGIREIARVLRPGGRMLLADHTAPRWLRRLGAAGVLPPHEAGRLATDAGLALDRTATLGSRWLWLLVAHRPDPAGS